MYRRYQAAVALLTPVRRYIAEILPIRRKTLSNQSINLTPARKNKDKDPLFHGCKKRW